MRDTFLTKMFFRQQNDDGVSEFYGDEQYKLNDVFFYLEVQNRGTLDW